MSFVDDAMKQRVKLTMLTSQITLIEYIVYHYFPGTYLYRRFNAIVSQLKMHYFSGGAFESLIASQLLKKEKYI